MTDGTMSDLSSPPFSFPDYHSFPPFFTIQPNAHTRLSQLKKWSSLIQAYCRHHRIYRLSIPAAVESPLFRNAALRKRLSTTDVRVVIDWMVSGDGEKRAEWIDISSKTNAFIWWRTPEEWAGIIEDWVHLYCLFWALFCFALSLYFSMLMIMLSFRSRQRVKKIPSLPFMN